MEAELFGLLMLCISEFCSGDTNAECSVTLSFLRNSASPVFVPMRWLCGFETDILFFNFQAFIMSLKTYHIKLIKD